MTDTLVVLSTHSGLPMQENAVTASSGTSWPTTNPTNAVDSASDSVILIVDITLEPSRNNVRQALERLLKAIDGDPYYNQYFSK